MKVVAPLVKNISAPSGIAAATSAIDAGIENYMVLVWLL